MAKGGGRRTGNSRSRGVGKGSNKGAPRATKNADGTVTMATKGKLATTPRGSGAARKPPLQNSVQGKGPYVVPQPGRKAINANAKV